MAATAPVPETLPGGSPAPVSPTPEDPGGSASSIDFRSYRFDGVAIDAVSPAILVLPVSPDFTATGYEFVVTDDTLTGGGTPATIAFGYSADGSTSAIELDDALTTDGSARGNAAALVTPAAAGANTHVYVEVTGASDQSATISVLVSGHVVPSP